MTKGQIDIAQINKELEFDLATQFIGPLHIRTLSIGRIVELLKRLPEFRTSPPKTVARAALAVLASKVLPDTIEGADLSDDEVARISEAELETFAKSFRECNPSTFRLRNGDAASKDEKKYLERKDGESESEYLRLGILARIDI